jgi:hypothetical protein
VVEGGGADLVCCGEEMKLLSGDVAKNMMEKNAETGFSLIFFVTS